MSYEPIITKLVNKPDKLKFTIRKKKGEPNLIVLPKNEIQEEVTKYYQEAKSLKPFGQYKTPYWSIIELLQPTFTRSKYASEEFYHQFFHRETEYLYKKYMPMNVYNDIISNDLKNLELYSKYVSLDPKNFLFISNIYYQESVEELFFFREKNSVYSDKDSIDYAVVNDFLLDKRRKRDYQYLEELKQKYSNFRLIESNKNICHQPEFDNLKDKYDIVHLIPEIYYWPLKKYSSYISGQFTFNCLIISLNKLVKNGTLFFPVREINNQITLDIIAIINYYFKKVEIFKGTLQPRSSYFKFIVAQNFKGITEKQYSELLDISKKWDIIQPDCFTKTTKFSEDGYYIKSILNYQDNLREIQDFEMKEDERKSQFFIDIVNTYNMLKNGGDKKLREIINKKVFNSIEIFKSLGIFKKLNESKIEKDILREEVELKYETNLFKFVAGSKDLTQKIQLKKINFNLDKLDDLTNRLKITKRSLDNMSMSDYEDVAKKIKKFVSLRHVLEKKYTLTKTSQGFVKMFEILKIFNLLKVGDKTHKTFHLCEAPGQFIMATNHYLKTETKNQIFDWIGQSLIGKKALADNYKLMKKYPDHWDFGSDKKGDITSLKNIKYYGEKYNDVDLITFDCGFDFGDKTIQTYQDKFTSNLNYCQILILLQSLKLTGSFVIKVFLPQTVPYIISLNYILYCCFQEVFLYKPFVNPVASEIYIIGRGFKGVDNAIIQRLIELKDSIKEEDVLLNIPLDFLEEYEKGIKKFVEANIENIINILYLVKNKKILSNKEDLERIRDLNTSNWIKYFGIKKINKRDLL